MTAENSADPISSPVYHQSDEPYHDEPAHQPRETTPLISRRDDEGKARRFVRNHRISIAIIILVSLLMTPIYRRVFIDPLSDQSRKDIRRKWELEKLQHGKEVSKWQQEIHDYRDQELNLLHRLTTVREDIEEREERNEYLRREALAWEGRARHAEKEENEALARKNAYERKLRDEQEKMAKMRLYWDGLLGDEQCLGHDSIHYRALLANLKDTIDPVDACKATSITINGVYYATPHWCEDVGNNNVYGHWTVTNESKCASYWEYFKDKGCTASGSRKRRFEAPLAGAHDSRGRERLCHTTPATIMGQTFSSPLSCPDWGAHGFWGIWDVRDDSCA